MSALKRKSTSADQKKAKKTKEEKSLIDRLRERHLNWKVDQYVIYEENGRPKVGELKKREDGSYITMEKYTKKDVNLAKFWYPPMRMMGGAKLAGEGELMFPRDDPSHEAKRAKVKRSYGVSPGGLPKRGIDDDLATVQKEFVERMNELRLYLLPKMFDCDAEELNEAKEAVRNTARYAFVAELKCSNADQVKAKARKDKALAKRIEDSARELFVANCKKAPFYLSEEAKEEGKPPIMFVSKKVWKSKKKYTGKRQEGPEGPPKESLPSTPQNWPRIVDEMKKIDFEYEPVLFNRGRPNKNGDLQIKPNKIAIKYKGDLRTYDNPFFNPAFEFPSTGKRAASLVNQQFILGCSTGGAQTDKYGLVAFMSGPLTIDGQEEAADGFEESIGDYGGYAEDDVDDQVIDYTNGKVAAKSVAVDGDGDEKNENGDGAKEEADEKEDDDAEKNERSEGDVDVDKLKEQSEDDDDDDDDEEEEEEKDEDDDVDDSE